MIPIVQQQTARGAARVGGILLLLVALSASAPETPVPKKALPSYVPVCSRGPAPELDACVKAAVEALRGRLRGGIRRMRVPPIDPFELPALHVNRDLPALSVNASLQDISVGGAGDFRIDSLHVDGDALTLQAQVTLPLLRVNCLYSVAGRLLTAPLLGRGAFRANFSDVAVGVSGRAERTSVGGVEYARLSGLQLRLRLGASDIDFDNDDSSAAATAAAALSFVRGNSAAALEVVTPVVEEVAAEVALQILNPIFARLPLAEILPEA